MPGYDPDRDLAIVSSMVPELEHYLLSDELYWPIGGPSLPGGGEYPRLTFGGLFLALNRLGAVPANLSPEQSASLARCKELLETTRSKWVAVADRKLAREIKSRLDLWSAYLQDCSENRSSCADYYPQQVQYRAMLELLFSELSRLSPASPYLDQLAMADRRLRAYFSKGEFVWDPALQASFPPDKFWFLYGSI